MSLLLAQKLKIIRGYYRKSAAEMADSIGISRAAMHQYESGDHEPGSAVVASICHQYNVSADWLLDTGVHNGGVDFESKDKDALLATAQKMSHKGTGLWRRY